jgi:nicotinamidase-related amidase
MQNTHVCDPGLKSEEIASTLAFMKNKFPLTSEQLELLIAFEEATGLNQLAEKMMRDPSVVSRNIQRIAEDYPVLTKIKGRWELTPLGLQTNELTRNYLKSQQSLLIDTKKKQSAEITFSDKSVLIIINAQKGLLDATQNGRNNSEAENNIAKILNHWRSKNRKVIHIQHASEKTNSMFYRNSPGFNFLDALKPTNQETIIEKTKASSFTDTHLEATLNQVEASDITLVGFTANECIDSTARDAASLSFSAYVVCDATAMFDLVDTSGKLIKAERIHRLTMANINAFYAKVIETSSATK